jgi:hypothetical protein
LTPETADALSRLSAFAIFVFLTGLAGLGLYRRWWVLGWIYDQERAARLNAETQALRNVEALEASGAATSGLVKELVAVRRELKGVRDDLRKLVSARDRA